MKLGLYFEIDNKAYTAEQAKEIYEYLKGYFDKSAEQVPVIINPSNPAYPYTPPTYPYFTWTADNAGGMIGKADLSNPLRDE